MPKIRSPGEEDRGKASPYESSEETEESYDETNRAVSQIIRYVMNRELKQQPIRKEHLSLLCSGVRNNYDDMIRKVNSTIMEVYGLELTPLPETGKTKGNQTRIRPNFILTSSLEPHSRKLLGEIWQQFSEEKVPNDRSTQDPQFFLPKYQKAPFPVTSKDMVKMGLTTFILGILTVAENHLTDKEITAALKKIGLSESLNECNSNIGMNIPDLVSHLVRHEYLAKETQKNSSGTEEISYTMGRRSVIEFSPLAVFELVEEVYGPHFDVDTKKKTIVTIERAFGKKMLHLLPERELQSESHPISS